MDPPWVDIRVKEHQRPSDLHHGVAKHIIGMARICP